MGFLYFQYKKEDILHPVNRDNTKFHLNQDTTVSKLDDGSDYDYNFKL